MQGTIYLQSSLYQNIEMFFLRQQSSNSCFLSIFLFHCKLHYHVGSIRNDTAKGILARLLNGLPVFEVNQAKELEWQIA